MRRKSASSNPAGLPAPLRRLEIQGPRHDPAKAPVVVLRTERKSWITIAVTGFGALLLRYLKTVRERGKREGTDRNVK